MDSPLDIANEMVRSLDRAQMPDSHIGMVRRYLKGHHDLPYCPDGAVHEYISLAHRSITNWLPLVSSSFSKALFVDGYRTGKSAENSRAWAHWQANRMDARQTIAMKGAIEYGTSYVMVLPGEPSPVIKAMPARKTWAWYESDDDDYPIAGLVQTGTTLEGTDIFNLYYGDSVYTFERQGVKPDSSYPNDPYNPFDGPDLTKHGGRLTLVASGLHGMGDFVPWVRFRDRLDDEAVGVIRPLIPIQNRINENVFSLLIAIQYSSFRQRWATGLAIPRDNQEKLPDGSDNPNFGKPLEPFKAAVNRLWVSESPDTKFGDFAQTDVSGHLRSYESAVKTLISIAESSPLIMVGDLSNIASEAFATLNDSMNRKLDEFRTLFGEAWEQVFALVSMAADEEIDVTAQVRWRDTEPRSFSQIVDGLSKLYTMGAPAEGLWEMIPGLTDQDIERWRELAARPTDIDILTATLNRTAAQAA